jgi:hypothetical protein
VIYQAIIDQYLPDYSDLISNLRGFVRLQVDAGCAAPAARIAAFIKNANKKVYLYDFGRLSKGGTPPRGLASLAPAWYALGHTDMSNTKLIDPQDAVLSKDIITMISTFARNGLVVMVTI